jgi:peptidoglycan/xylan/chitin deacetylase (PgdA/CDA1 family)
MLGAARQRAFGSRAAAALTRWAARGRVIVLCYHDLRRSDDFSSWLRVDVETFRSHLELFSSLGRFVSPATLSEPASLEGRGLFFLMTFDDGYPNNLGLGLPVLEQFDAPAVFFISTWHVVTGEPFWFDRVVTRIQAAGLTRLDLSSLGLRDYAFAREDGARRWTGIQALLADLKHLGNPGDPGVERILAFFDTEYGAIAAPYDDRFRPIRMEELRVLASGRSCYLGSHGHRHEILTRLDDAALAESLTRSKQVLEHVSRQPVTAVAYPNGDEDARVRTACAGAGYRLGFATQAGLVTPTSDPFRLPRVLVGGYDTAPMLAANINELVIRSVVGHA